MRIDSHQHFWRFDAQRDSWITDEMSILRRDFLPDELFREMRANGIDRCVAVQTDQSEAETNFLLNFAGQHPQIAGVVGWVDLSDERIDDRLAAFAKFSKLRGFRHIVQAEPNERFLLRENFLRGIGRLVRYGFTYDILIYSRHLPVAEEFISRFPEQKFVVDHLAKPSIKVREIDEWTHGIRDVAKHANVYCKLSGLVTEANWKNWSLADLRPYLDIAFEAFGIDRLMFGSDWPVCLLAGSYAQVKEAIESYARDLSSSEKEKLFGLNAARFYGLAA